MASKANIGNNMFYNMDCVQGCKNHIKDNSIKLIITDPPYGISGDKLDQHYNRDESYVVDGYIEIPQKEYNSFSYAWIKEAERILEPGGSIYIVSGYTNLYDILDALRQTSLEEINHIIWKYNFGVHTTRKYVSSHYHILYYKKPGKETTFNLTCRYGQEEKIGKSCLNYADREDVWVINREYKPGKKKNKNELPMELLIKMMQYSSNDGDLVCDLFLGGFSTARIAIGLNRKFVGFELSDKIFNVKIKEIESIVPGDLLGTLRKPAEDILTNKGTTWEENDIQQLKILAYELKHVKMKKAEKIEILCKELKRGRFAIVNMMKKLDIDEKYELHFKENGDVEE
jgi:site-specific DNA-methyltransferase (adenine-specific)